MNILPKKIIVSVVSEKIVKKFPPISSSRVKNLSRNALFFWKNGSFSACSYQNFNFHSSNLHVSNYIKFFHLSSATNTFKNQNFYVITTPNIRVSIPNMRVCQNMILNKRFKLLLKKNSLK